LKGSKEEENEITCQNTMALLKYPLSLSLSLPSWFSGEKDDKRRHEEGRKESKQGDGRIGRRNHEIQISVKIFLLQGFPFFSRSLPSF